MPKARSENFKLENMRLSHPHIFAPQKMEDNGVVKLKFNATLLWPKGADLVGKKADGTSINIMEEAVRIAREEWGDKAEAWIKDGLIKNPFLDGDGPQGVNKRSGERHEGYAGHRFIRTTANEDRQPEAYDDKIGADGKLVKLVDPKRLYPGCKVHAVLNLFTWENAKGGKGLSFGLNMVQFAADGERLGGDGGGNPDAFFSGAKPDAAKAAATTGGAGAGGLFA